MASDITFEVDPGGLNAVIGQGGAVDSFLFDKAQLVAQVARREAPDGKDPEFAPRTEPKLKDAIRVRPLVNRGFQIIANVSYALPVHQGVRGPRVIVPNTKKALRFRARDGEIVIRAKVSRHPGQKANPFLRRALQQVLG